MNSDFQDFGFWCAFMARAWGGPRTLTLTLDVILDAGRAREEWAQADLFLAARTSTDPVIPYSFCICPVGSAAPPRATKPFAGFLRL